MAVESAEQRKGVGDVLDNVREQHGVEATIGRALEPALERPLEHLVRRGSGETCAFGIGFDADDGGVGCEAPNFARVRARAATDVEHRGCRTLGEHVPFEELEQRPVRPFDVRVAARFEVEGVRFSSAKSHEERDFSPKRAPWQAERAEVIPPPRGPSRVSRASH